MIGIIENFNPLLTIAMILNLQSKNFQYNLYRPTNPDILKRVKLISERENIRIDPHALDKLIEYSMNDLR